ncbi:hypothetical protein N9C81_01530, partial [Planctomycetota bacterium]|nr:hypothetical protein [Planctomycetota bacterium]
VNNIFIANLILCVGVLFCTAPLTAQEQLVFEDPDPVTAAELAGKITKAILGGPWKSSCYITGEEGGSKIPEIFLDIAVQDISHFSIAVTLTSENPFEFAYLNLPVPTNKSDGVFVQNYKIMFDGEFLYAAIDGIYEMSEGMFVGPVKFNLGRVFPDLTVEIVTEKIVSMLASEIEDQHFAEAVSTEDHNLYTSHDYDRLFLWYFNPKYGKHGSFSIKSVESYNKNYEKLTFTTNYIEVVEEFAEGTFTYENEAQDITAFMEEELRKFKEAMRELAALFSGSGNARAESNKVK